MDTTRTLLAPRDCTGTMADGENGASVLASKRTATRYRVLVQIAERQPAVSQREIAESIGVTAQAVSDYLRGLIEEGYVDKGGRGRYEVTKEGVDWLIGRTDELLEFARHVSENVIEQVEVETAIAETPVEAGERVSVGMSEGVLRANRGDDGSATAVAVTGAAAGEEVGLTDFEGVVDYELGTVTAVPVPRVQDGGSAAVAADRIGELATGADIVTTAGTEALAAARRAGVEPDVRFGTPEAVREATMKGLDVLLVVTEDELTAHTEGLREANVGCEVVDAT